MKPSEAGKTGNGETRNGTGREGDGEDCAFRSGFACSGAAAYAALAFPFLLSLSVWLLARWKDILYAWSLPLLGELFGLAGLSYMAFTLLLSTRLKVVDRLFCGLDKAFRFHSLAGQLSLIFISFHPLLLLQRYAQTVFEYWGFLSISGWLAKDAGVVALYSLVAGIVVTLYLRMRYSAWRILHKLMFLVFLISAYHSLFATTMPDIARAYIAAISAMGIVAGGYSVSREYFAGKRLNVKSVKRLNEKVVEIEFDGSMSFTPGQFIFVKFMKPGLGEFHPFSIISKPGENLRIAVKALGDFTSRLSGLESGDIAVVDGPYGGFSVERGGRKQLWIAGGIGITPFISMSSVVADRDVVLIYSCKRKEEFIHLRELGRRVKLMAVETDKEGRVDADKVAMLVPDFRERDVFLCGPKPMMKSLENGLRRKGVRTLIYEDFSLR